MTVVSHLRVTAIGTLGNPATESFSYGFNLADTTSSGPIDWFTDETNPAYTDIANDVKAFHGRPESHIHPVAVLQWVKIARIGPDPADPNRAIYTDDPVVKPAVQAGAGSPVAAVLPQAALVVSLNTNRRGPTGKGRFYLPMPGLTPANSDGFKVPLAAAEAIRGSTVTLINALNNWPGVDFGDLDVHVISSKGYASKVTSVRVGRLIDTMQSRRRALGEAYTADANVAV